ncbi:MAG: chromate transporter, partial [Candidatus Nanopelagicales bacterium]|nr:chromate transporter [Candidatus Nanopelagicales bacterium]
MPEQPVSVRDATKVWAYVGLNSFGGPAGQIAVMHREVVDNRKWISERRFLHALNYCMVLPGPEAQQLATYIGWLMNGIRGGLIAGVLFVVPGFIVMMALSAMYAVYGQVSWVAGLLLGLQAAVLALVVQALLRMAGRMLKTGALRWVAVAAFVALFFFAVPFPLVIIAAGLVGWWAGRGGGSMPSEGTEPVLDEPAALLSDDETLDPGQARRALIAAACCLVLWLLPVVALVVMLGTDSTFTQVALLFSKTAV